jgi:DNA-binding MarR family transcriptional regulator
VVAFRRANVVLDATALAAQGELGVGRTDLVALELLTTAGRLTPGQLGEQLMISSGTVTGVVDRLVAAGYVTRSGDPHDRRRIVVALTAKGRRRFREAFEQRWTWLQQIATELSGDDLDCVTRFLGRVHEFAPGDSR